jgi:hypothetical protein
LPTLLLRKDNGAMLLTGTIRPAWGAKRFSHDALNRFKSRTELQPEPIKATLPSENQAYVVIDGRRTGKVAWTDKWIVVAVAPSARAIVLQWADALDGFFTEESTEPFQFSMRRAFLAVALFCLAAWVASHLRAYQGFNEVGIIYGAFLCGGAGVGCLFRRSIMEIAMWLAVVATIFVAFFLVVP